MSPQLYSRHPQYGAGRGGPGEGGSKQRENENRLLCRLCIYMYCV